jgi:hypothetical protein
MSSDALDKHKSIDLLGPAACRPAEPITLRDKLACVWKQLLAAPSKLASPLIFDP